MIPFWLKLIRTHNKNGGHGLTLPFLVGALRNPVGTIIEDEKENIKDALSLLVSIRDETPDTSYISLTVCPGLQQPVFHEGLNTPLDTTLTKVPKLDNIECCLYVSASILPNGKQSVEDLMDSLWQVSSAEIVGGKFSFANGNFMNFTDKDYQLIKDAHTIEDEHDA
jgi:hypothetical protein